jgi:putative FmdB family regulatory protein
MPIYEYRCASCGFDKEYLQKLSDAPITDCESCGKPSMTKLISAAGFQLKGSGWYVTDFKNNGKKDKPESKDRGESKDGGESKPDAAKAEAGDKPSGDTKSSEAKTPGDAKPSTEAKTSSDSKPAAESGPRAGSGSPPAP